MCHHLVLQNNAYFGEKMAIEKLGGWAVKLAQPKVAKFLFSQPNVMKFHINDQLALLDVCHPFIL